jgi:transposase
MGGIEITRKELTSDDLRRQARRARSAEAGARMLALANVLEGKSREESATLAGMTRQTLRDWVHRYNDRGLDGLYNGKKTGAKPKLTAAQKTGLREIIIKGPDPEKDGVVRWRCCDLKVVIEKKFKVSYHERYLGRLLRALGFSRITARPRHPKGDPEAQETFKKTLPPS